MTWFSFAIPFLQTIIDIIKRSLLIVIYILILCVLNVFIFLILFVTSHILLIHTNQKKSSSALEIAGISHGTHKLGGILSELPSPLL